MLYKSIPLCLTLPEAGQTIPESIRAIGFISDLRLVYPEQRALGDVFDMSHRLDTLLVPQLHPALLRLDAPADDALPEYLPNGHPIYPSDRSLFHKLRKQLLETYYRTYYAAITKVLESGQVKAGIDCHAFSSKPIPQATGKPLRPLICLSNNGDALGSSRFGKGPLTCPQDILRDLRDIVAAKFIDSPESGQVLLNTPVSGGYLIRVQAKKQIPWIRMDVAKELFLNAEGGISKKRVEMLRDHFENILVSLCQVYEWM